MKTVKMLLLLGAIVAGTTLSCKKQNEQPAPPDKNRQLVSQVEALTDQYIAQEQLQPVLKAEKGKGILRKDEEGAVIGGVTGGIGGIPGGPGGVLAGAGLGALSGGVGASLKAWLFPEAATIPMNPPATNPDNTYDEAGAWHYTLMAELMQNPSSVVDPDGTINYTNYRNYVFERLQEPYPQQVQIASSFITEQSISADVEAAHYDNLVDFAHSLTPQQVTETERQILIAYFSAFENMSNGASFSSYSINVENAVTASDLSDIQKEKLLIAMATLRHGVAFYGL
jgi:hypothetical protein